MSCWYKETIPGEDIVVSTRIRIARNLVGLPFPKRMNPEQKKATNLKVKEALDGILFHDTGKLRYIEMQNVPEEEAYAMVERHVISPNFAEDTEGRALLLSDDETVSIMLCEEDHIRIQVILGALNPEKALFIANEIDDALSQKLQIAFHEQLGFLTECPTNLGTGLRASVMLHLPVLESVGAISAITNSVSKIGLTVRGMYGEGSNSHAALYQLSNQVTLGISEQAALDNLKAITLQIVEREKAARNDVPKEQLEDTVWRAYGILKNARLLSSEEMMNLISQIKLGVSMGIINKIPPSLPMELMVEAQPAMLQKTYGRMTGADRDICRAKMIRERLS